MNSESESDTFGYADGLHHIWLYMQLNGISFGDIGESESPEALLMFRRIRTLIYIFNFHFTSPPTLWCCNSKSLVYTFVVVEFTQFSFICLFYQYKCSIGY